MTEGPILLIDTETTRLRRPGYPHGRRIWEIGGARVDADSDTGGTGPDLHCFICIEDLGLVEMLPDRSAAFDPSGELICGPDAAWFKQLPDDVQKSLAIGDFHGRHPQQTGQGTAITAWAAADMLLTGPWLQPVTIGEKTVPVTLVGVVPSFDEEGLHHLLVTTGVMGPDDQPYHYQPWDAETYAAGALGWAPPVDSDALNAALSVGVGDLVKHAAFDDAVWAGRTFGAARRLRRRG